MTRQEILDTLIDREAANIELAKLRTQLNVDLQAAQVSFDQQVSTLQANFQAASAPFAKQVSDASDKLNGAITKVV